MLHHEEHPSFYGYPYPAPPGWRAWEIHLRTHCPGWLTPAAQRRSTDHFTTNLGQAMDDYSALAAEQGHHNTRYRVCGCMVAPITEDGAPPVHATISVELNPH